ncbi:MAG TPA: V-type ATP synthase subunit D [Acholeplasmataceae bacterium]|jgi:V/A-type H+-transporting ATPase subunit D|nr:V-type ATP synthase subunit D [Acholeplasmataceae bacterium]
MSRKVIPTKGNLMRLNARIKLATKGYELMDRKRNILVREMMSILNEVKELRKTITTKFKTAYKALQDANITLGIVSDIAKSIPVNDGLSIKYRSVMGVEIPKVSHEAEHIRLTYGFGATNTKFDYAYKTLLELRTMIVTLAEIDNATYRLANAIRKTRKRANALNQIVLPQLTSDIKFIKDTLEEREREAFSRQKMIKKHI